MDKEKLKDAALAHCDDFTNYITTVLDVIRAFCGGAEWLMSQPLADRLTDEEKERIKSIYRDLIPLKGHMVGIVGKMMLLEQIFGKEMFNEK